MNSTILYFIEANVCLAFFFCLYQLFLKRESNFKFQRLFLLMGVISAFVMPLVNVNLIPVPTTVSEAVLDKQLAVTLDEISVVADTPSSPPLAEVFFGAYLVLTFLLFTYLILKFIRLAQLFKSADRHDHIIESVQKIPSFSFFQYIYIGNADQYSESEKSMIILHEQVHCRELHSLDILLIELTKVVFWFNPVVYVYKSAIQSVHEFRADEVVTQQENVNEYSNLLAKGGLLAAGIPVVSPFNTARIVERISRMHAGKNVMKNWKALVMGVLVGGLFLAVSCRDQGAAISPLGLLHEKMPIEVSKKLESLIRQYPKSEFVVIQMNDEGRKTHKSLLEKRDDFCSVVTFMLFDKDMRPGEYKILEFGDRIERLKHLQKNETDIFEVTDEPTSPLDGFDGLAHHLYQALQYPKEAKTKGIEGTVFVGGIVSTDGRLTNVNVIKSVDDLLDTEAVRALLLVSSRWNPAIHDGKIVKQKVVIPVTFSLK